MSTTSTLPTRWANTPWPLLDSPQKDTMSHYAVHMATDMVHVHNMFLRALNSIILQSPHVVKPGDIADLLAYTKTVVITIDAHHFGEEEYLFPALAAYTKNQDIMSANQTQHAAFHAGLSRLGEYCKSTSPAEYSHTTFKGLIDAFAPSLYEHLRDEIPTILALKVYPSDELRRMWVQAEKHIADVGSYDEMLPLAFGCMDRGFEGGRHKFPPAPWWVAWVVRYWFARRHQSVWRFNPCDMWGVPRPLTFLPTFD